MFPKRVWNILAIATCLSVLLYFFWFHGLDYLPSPDGQQIPETLAEKIIPQIPGVAPPTPPAPPARPEDPILPLPAPPHTPGDQQLPPPPKDEHIPVTPGDQEVPPLPVEEQPTDQQLPATPEIERPPGPIHKNLPTIKRPPISDNFPLAESGDKLPAIASWNRPPAHHVPEKTPLFIGFTRNWPILQQCVLSYIAAGWPPEDIYVVDNTGTMKSNFPPGQLTLQNPFYLNVQRLTEVFGVNVISTPTLLAFAQLQNFYIFTALEQGWDHFWWSHMDVLAITEENYKEAPFKSLYMRAVDVLRNASSPEYMRDPITGEKTDWAIQFFAYDWLALNNVKSFVKLGGWDTFIPYYTSDCDLHARITMAGLDNGVVNEGRIMDVGSSIDLSLLFRREIDPENPPKTMEELDKLPEDKRNGTGYSQLVETVQACTEMKVNGAEERNSWQYRQQGGEGEPFYRDPQGFEAALQLTIAAGVNIFEEKWGHHGCELKGLGLTLTDAWHVEHDWEAVKEPELAG